MHPDRFGVECDPSSCFIPLIHVLANCALHFPVRACCMLNLGMNIPTISIDRQITSGFGHGSANPGRPLLEASHTAINRNFLPPIMGVHTCGDYFGKQVSKSIHPGAMTEQGVSARPLLHHFLPPIMGVYTCGDLFGKQGSKSIDPGVMTVQGVSARPLRGATDFKIHMSQTYRGGGGIHTGSSTTSEAIALLEHYEQQGAVIDSYKMVHILKLCLKQKDIIATRRMHDVIIQTGMDKNPYVATTLLNAYITCGRLRDARRVFDGIQKTDRNVITWTLMIRAYAKSRSVGEAYRLFLQMKRESIQPDAVTYITILTSLRAGPLEWVKEVHRHALEAGLESDVRVGNALVHVYAKNGSIDDARLVFEGLKIRDEITWNAMIGAYAANGCGGEAFRLFLQMKQEGFKPDAFTCASILNPAASAGASEWVKEVHIYALEAGLESDLRVGNALVHMFAESGSIDDARLVFDRMEKRDVCTWNTMIGGLAQHGCGQEALELFVKMNAGFVKPDETTFVALLSACCHAGLVDDGRRIFSTMTQDYGVEHTVVHYTCMVDLLGRAGHLEEAKSLIDNMPVKPNAITWKSLLGACRTYSNVELGEYAAKEVLKLEPKDASPYVLLSNIYAAAGKWKEVSSVRTRMQERGVRKEPGRSWIEVDNKIHEFVVGDTSHPEAKAIYSELKKLSELLKARGYIPDTKLVLHNVNEEEKELALCSHSEKLAIAYGLLRVPPGKPIHVKKNLRVCLDCHGATKLISEVSGREIIVRDAIRFHHFKDGICSCRDYW